MTASGSRKVRSEAGQVAGMEAVLIGTVVILVGVLIAVNAWAHLQSRAVLADSAHVFLRAYTAPRVDTEQEAEAAALAELDGALSDRNRSLDEVEVALTVVPAYGPCAEATVTLTARTPALRIPLVGSIGNREVSVRRVELLPPAGQQPAERYVRRATPCYAD